MQFALSFSPIDHHIGHRYLPHFSSEACPIACSDSYTPPSLCKGGEVPGGLTHAIGHRVIREPTEVLHPDKHTRMPAFNGSILEIMQIFHGRVVHDLAGQYQHIVGFGTLRHHDTFEC